MLEIKLASNEVLWDFGVAYNIQEAIIEKESKGKINEGGYNYYPRQVSKFGVYRVPGAILFSGFLPLTSLAFLTFAIYGQPADIDNYSDRIANYSVALLAYIAYMPTFRQSIPPTPYLTLGDYVLYLNMLGVLLAILQSFIISRELDWSPTAQFTFSAVFYITGGILMLGPYIFLIILQLMHKFVWKKKYLSESYSIKMNAEKQNLNEYYNHGIGPGISADPKNV